ncbi:MAG TPA: diguanylate cyclase [Leptospiraceae bacterium]|nr:diguanylate cyclase [Leptospiraceae bacterium]HMW06282.1 diguanylate cyclase [Leptospiraceae bacterium]HMX34607.1 diguanylate cyclase [Leptospiraceae bacterium]HMY31744.1 diguanylate cyclase [Leptospiraceae bacterium]HMZ64537.1 diguanylate cyclase [Leptospiraceae bacterium]
MKLVIDKEKLKEIQEKNHTEKKYTVLLVDDEPANIEALNMILEDKYNIIKAYTGMEALAFIKSQADPSRINLIISDQRMPGMTGVEFLKQTIPIIPKTVRMILTGFTDINDIIDSINEGQVYKFHTKPIEPKDLLVSIQRALEAYELEKQNIVLIEKLKEMNENLEQLVRERTEQLEESMRTLQRQKEELEYLSNFQDTLVNELEVLSITDPLTGLANRRWLESFTQEECDKAIRKDKKISVLMLDIDHFKKYNDFYGHAMGDKCIKIVAESIKKNMRKTDLAARYGGEEFCCVLPHTTQEEAIQIADNLIQTITKEAVPHEKSDTASIVTISVGVFTTMPQDKSLWKELILNADANLYKAKQNGRNQIWFKG